MQTIWKKQIQVTDTQEILVPVGAKFLSVQEQFEGVCIWFLCNPQMPYEKRKLSIYGTGQAINGDPGNYVTTFQMREGVLVFHVFESAR